MATSCTKMNNNEESDKPKRVGKGVRARDEFS